MNVGVIDYSAGNLQSVLNALAALRVDAQLIRSPDALKTVDALILPGQGAFGDCVGNLKKQELFTPVQEWIAADKPYLGICIGYQILFDSSEESPGTEGLGAIPGKVIHFPKDSGLKIPHMGWNKLNLTHPENPLWDGIPRDPHMYFVHSYYPAPDNPAVIAATTDYGLTFAAAVHTGNLTATQFHPEKSQTVGLKLLQNYIQNLPRP